MDVAYATPLKTGVMKLESKRIAIGSVIAILTTSALVTIVGLILGIGYREGVAIALVSGVVAIFVATAILIVWGIPVHLTLSKRKVTGPLWYGLAGFLPAPVFVFGFKPLGLDPFEDLVLQSISFGAFGIAGALTFWFYVVKTAS